MSHLFYRMYQEAIEIMDTLKSDCSMDGEISDTEFDRGVRSILSHRYAMIRSKMDKTIQVPKPETREKGYTGNRGAVSKYDSIRINSADFETSLRREVTDNGEDDDQIPRYFKFHAIMQGSLCLTTLVIERRLILIQARRLVNEIMNYVRRGYGTNLKKLIHQAVSRAQTAYAGEFKYIKQIMQGAPGGDINLFETEFTRYAFEKKGSTWRLFHSLLLENDKQMPLTTTDIPPDLRDTEIQHVLDTLTEKIELELYDIQSILAFISNKGSEKIASKLQTEFDAACDALEVMGMSQDVAFNELNMYFKDNNYRFESVFHWVWNELVRGYKPQTYESPP
jgi:hypothetical protein